MNTTTTTTTTVNIPTMLHKAAAWEDSRFAINGAMIRANDHGAYAYVTDGKVLACVPIDGHPPAGEYIVPEAALPRLKTRRELRIVMGEGEPVGALSKEGDDVGLVDGKFPPLADVLPAVSSDGVCREVREDSPHITLGVDTLKRLLDALTDTRGSKADADGKAPSVTLILSANADGEHGRKPVIVLGNAGTGLIMPVANEADAVEQYAERRAAIVANLKG